MIFWVAAIFLLPVSPIWPPRRTFLPYGRPNLALLGFLSFFAASILDIKNSHILLADHVRRTERHCCAKFHQHRSIHCGISRFFCFLDGDRRHLGFLKFSILNFCWHMRSGGSSCIIVPNFINAEHRGSRALNHPVPNPMP